MIDKSILWLARMTALFGGTVLIGIVMLTVVSVSGRSLIAFGFGPVPGDYELVEAGVAFAVFAFLPWCHLVNGHAAVDLLAERLGARFNKLMTIISDTLMAGAALLIAMRLAAGMVDKHQYAETTFILEFPLWWFYAAALYGAVVFVIISIYRIYLDLSGRELCIS